MKIKKHFLIIFLLIFFQYYSSSQAAVDFEWIVGEELTYSVKWSFLRLGTLRLQVLEQDTMENQEVYHCRIYIDSNPSLPFVSIHDVYESYIDADSFYSHLFESYENKKEHVIYTRYDFDYDRMQVHIRVEIRRDGEVQVELDSTGTIDNKIQDSLSLLYFARAFSNKQLRKDITTFVYNKFKQAFINFSGEPLEIKTRGKKVRGYYLDGRLRFVGIAGIKEDFKGWFSTDGQKVPLKAYMKAFIGSVKIELEDWKNWNGDRIFD